MLTIEIDGITDLVRILHDLREALKHDYLGKVYHRGAGPRRYEWWVQSAERQTALHKRTGWRTDETAVEDFEKRARQILDEVKIDLTGGRIKNFLHDFVELLLDEVLEYMQFYPPPPPNSTYVRTYLLHDRWDTEIKV
jgi:hypothetical protein